jgi:hypothetical protein
MDNRGAERSSYVFSYIIRNDGVTGSSPVCGTNEFKYLDRVLKYRNFSRYAIGTFENAGGPALHYNIQIHLPSTKDVEVFNAIFKSLREHLLD